MAGVTSIELSKLTEAKVAAEGEITKFTTAYTAIYTAKDDLRNNFKGKDAEKFASQLEAFRDDFVAMENLLKAYADELEVIRSKYASIQEQLEAAAAALSTGNA